MTLETIMARRNRLEPPTTTNNSPRRTADSPPTRPAAPPATPPDGPSADRSQERFQELQAAASRAETAAEQAAVEAAVQQLSADEYKRVGEAIEAERASDQRQLNDIRSPLGAVGREMARQDTVTWLRNRAHDLAQGVRESSEMTGDYTQPLPRGGACLQPLQQHIRYIHRHYIECGWMEYHRIEPPPIPQASTTVHGAHTWLLAACKWADEFVDAMQLARSALARSASGRSPPATATPDPPRTRKRSPKPRDGDLDESGKRVWLQGAFHSFGPQQRPLLIDLLKHLKTTVDEVLKRLPEIAGRPSFDMAIHRLRISLRKHLRRAPRQLNIALDGTGHITTRWTTRKVI
jgi:hypothetical protein